jgi:hypothetical protein
MLFKMKYILIIIVITTVGKITLFAQRPVSAYEFRWAFFHPFAALKIKKRLPKALVIYNEVKATGQPDSFAGGGKLDAFRHVYTMAYLARYIRVKKLRKLGRAHEKGNKRQFKNNKLEDGERPDSLACEMDLKNNESGFLLGSANKTLNDTALKTLVLEAITAGKAWYLKRNVQGQYVDCDNKPVDPALYKGKWFVPKCLIKTNE